MAVYYSPVFFGFRLLRKVPLKILLLLFRSCFTGVFPWLTRFGNRPLGECPESIGGALRLPNWGFLNRVFQTNYEPSATIFVNFRFCQ